ncbi:MULTISPECIES: sulfurtransferase TusA family protein [Aeromonas]|uniref:sulfurtransferase TusA family protein n=1 Tax=Aeromonas TaxID=642 RepID=UPI001FD26260|nr:MULTISPECIES: sulfurtransferase TusA family protein [Aeromonas]MCJ7927934.1 sulfurtransferase TusA family protein [Aeromonas sp. LsrichE-8G]MEA9419069.1 sulfurtransferase TusA family protein [Aeromonas caviae]MEA9422990.1 sulfurtransferase TusA family protein [Aeromonas caviae]MEA9428603.1 sulfurtransferase TusA family protein [Aeromonas caviae]MEA9433149.1 sulfurtransferase TusA family protein [Aeromonas caviae]
MEQLDLTPWRCPEPLIRLKLWLRQARPGQSVCIQLGDAGSRQDIPAYLHRQGHHVQTREESATRLSLLLVVARPPRDALLTPEPMPPTA